MTIPNRRDVIKKAANEGHRIAAVMPIHYPRALLRACGFHPIEVWGPPHVDQQEDIHFPEYTCEIVKKATHFLKSQEAESIDCILIPHTCDSLQGMGTVFKDFIEKDKPVLTLYHPRGRRQSDLEFLEKELLVLADKLSAISGRRPSSFELKEEIELEDRATAMTQELLKNRMHYDMSDRDFYTLIRSREYLSPVDFICYIERLPVNKINLKGPGIMISGIVPEPMSLFDHINEFGAHVIIDDLACCSRRLYKPFQGNNPFKGIAKQLMSMPPDTTVSTPYVTRLNYLSEQVKNSGAKAVLVYNMKFCEPELFYIPMLEKHMKEQGIPFLFVEGDLSVKASNQILNRINTFIEVIK